MLKYIWTILLIGTLWPASGQSPSTLKFRGRVVDRASQPIKGASIFFPKSSRTTLADENGWFEIRSNGENTIPMEVSAMGFASLDTLVVVADAKSLHVITLQQRVITLERVQVKGLQPDQKTAVLSRLSQRDIGETIGQSISKVLSRLPGVSLLNSGHRVNKPVVHGLHSNRILLLNQGVKLEGQQWGLEHAPELDPFSADEFELIKGAQTVRYGADALGGVLVARSKPIPADRLRGAADLIAKQNGRGGIVNIDFSGGFEPIPGLAWRIQGSGQRFGDSRTPSYVLGNTGSAELNFSTALQYGDDHQQWEAYYSRFATELGVFYGAHIGTIEDLLARLDHGQPLEHYNFSYRIEAPRQQVVHDLGKLAYKGTLGQRVEVDFQYAWQRNHRKEFDRRRSLADDVPMSNMMLSSHQIDLLAKIDNHQFGLQASNQINNNIAGTGTTPFIPNYDYYGLGVFGIHQLKVSRATIEAGWRYDFRHFDAAGYRYRYSNEELPEQYLMDDQKSFHNISGSLGIVMPIFKGWQYKSQLGLAWRAPNANELYSDGLHHGAAIYEIGQMDLKSEQALKWVHSFHRGGEFWKIDAEVYGQWIYNYIYALPHPDSVRQTIRGTFPVFSYEQDDALFYGVDVNVSWRIRKQLEYELSGSLVRAKNVTENRFLPYIPTDRLRHTLRWNFQQGSGVYFAFAHEFVAKQNRYEQGADFSAPPNAYHLFHLHLAYPFSWNEKQLKMALGVENLMNRSYKDYMDRFRYYAHREGRNITLSLHFKF